MADGAGVGRRDLGREGPGGCGCIRDEVQALEDVVGAEYVCVFARGGTDEVCVAGGDYSGVGYGAAAHVDAAAGASARRARGTDSGCREPLALHRGTGGGDSGPATYDRRRRGECDAGAAFLGGPRESVGARCARGLAVVAGDAGAVFHGAET